MYWLNPKLLFTLAVSGLLLSCGGGSSATSGDNSPAQATGQSEKQAVVSTTKQHPGYYVVLKHNNSPGQLAQLLGQRGLQGMVKQYAWREVENNIGSYDFSQIRADLAIAGSQKKYLIIQFDLSARGTDKVLPDYLTQDYVLSAQPGVPVLKVWDMYVIDRLNLLYAELSAHFDHEMYFEGVVIKTPDIQLNEQTKTKYAYSEEAHRAALIQLLSTSKTAFASSKVFWSIAAGMSNSKMNNDIAAVVGAQGVILGGAELLPDHNDWVAVFAPFYKAFKDRGLLFSVVGQSGYAHPHADPALKVKYWTLPSLAEHAKQQLGVSYLFWEQKVLRDPADSYQWSDVVPVLEAASPR